MVLTRKISHQKRKSFFGFTLFLIILIIPLITLKIMTYNKQINDIQQEKGRILTVRLAKEKSITVVVVEEGRGCSKSFRRDS